MFLTPLETDNKQILRRCAPQNDIAIGPQGDGRQAYNPNFRRSDFMSLRSPTENETWVLLWSDGVLEYWSVELKPTTPSLQYSITPICSSESAFPRQAFLSMKFIIT